MAGTNGTAVLNKEPPKKDRMAEVLTSEPLTTGYKATIPLDTIWGLDGSPWFWFRRDIENMLTHPIVLNALNNYKAGIAGAEFDCKSESDVVTKFCLEQVQRYWDIGVPQLQGGYDYGWIGAENLYDDVDGLLSWNGMNHFSPADTFLLTQGSIPVGVRVKHVKDKGPVDLWMASGSVPSKAMWYAHNPRWNLFYGQSQLFGAWRPWRRLAWKDGAESTIDMGVYRHAFAGPIVYYPEEDLQGPNPGSGNTTLDSNGNPRRFARDMARQMAEQLKTGAGVGFPSTCYPDGAAGAGKKKWEIELPKSVLNVAPLVEYINYLIDQIYRGVGVPPELIQAAETGSGYSGRRIPLEAFLDSQQHIGDRFLRLFVEEVLRPLVLWNFGPVKFDIKLRRLIETKNKASAGQPGQQPGGQTQTPPQPPAQKAANDQPEPTQDDGGDDGGKRFSANPLITDSIRAIARKALRRVA
jgi:hypothetical protein